MVPGAVKRPFWIHQLVEYILGLALVSLGLQSPEPEVPAAMGLLVVVNAAIVRRAPLSAFRLVTKAQHRLLDIGVIAALAIAAIQPWMPVLAADRLTIGGVAVILGVVWMRSSFVDRRARPASAAASAPVAPASSAATTPGATGSSSAAGDRSTEIGRTAGRAVGQGLRRARRLTRGSSEG
jgi:hypothetical protein